MKLQHLPIGARFEYEGVIYVKTGPLTASSEVGGQRVIPRYAVLRPAETATLAPLAGDGLLAKEQVDTAFERFFADAASLVPADRQADLNAARQEFRAALGL